MAKVLITGGSGRFAEHVARALAPEHDLRLFSRSKPPADREGYEWLQGDLNVYEDCERAVEGIDVIQHLGAVPFPSDRLATRERITQMGRDPGAWDSTITTNITGTYYLLTAAVKAGVETVVMAGSNCAFGHCGWPPDRRYPVHHLPLDESHPAATIHSYAYSKFAGEELLHMFTRASGIRTYVTRPAGIWDANRRKAWAESIAPADKWSGALWGWVASEDLAELHKLIQENARSLPDHDVFVANGLDSSALEPTMELLERFAPDLVQVTKGVSGHDALFSVQHAEEMVGWVPKLTWRELL